MTVRSGKSPPCSSLNISSPIDAEMSQSGNVVGSVARRPKSEVVAEMAALAAVERARMTAPQPPTPEFPGKFAYSQRRPRPLRRGINPAPQVFRVASIRDARESRDHEERERYLLEEAEKLARRPRTPTPPRRHDDFFDLARWSIQRWR